jgi:hypothetical protein
MANAKTPKPKPQATHNPSASDLKSALWETLQLVKNKQMDPIQANSVAFQAREVMRIVRTELVIAKMANAKPSAAMRKFCD